jgi:hypothetical protein
MGKLVSGRLAILAVSIFLICGLAITGSMEKGEMKSSGKMTMAQTALETMEVGDVEGHTLLFSQSEGTNASTEEGGLLDGAKVVNMSFSDLVKGTGTNQGYCLVTAEDGSAYTKWDATTTTVMSSEGPPMVSFEGEFTWIMGTGAFEGIQGTGVFKGVWTSETTYEFEWKGAYSIGK